MPNVTDKTLGALRQEVLTWPDIADAPHRFNGLEFQWNGKEIGHFHWQWGAVDVPFSRRVRDALIAEGRAQRHHYVPETGWVTYMVNREADLPGALFLLKLSNLLLQLRRNGTGSAAYNQIMATLADMGISQALHAAIFSKNAAAA
jgi:hypothetical protein